MHHIAHGGSLMPAALHLVDQEIWCVFPFRQLQ